MASILFLGGLSPAIGMMGGGEPGEDGVRIGETGNELLRGKGNNRGSGEKATGFGGTKVSLSMKSVTLTGGGVVKPGLGNSSEELGKNHGTIS